MLPAPHHTTPQEAKRSQNNNKTAELKSEAGDGEMEESTLPGGAVAGVSRMNRGPERVSLYIEAAETLVQTGTGGGNGTAGGTLWYLAEMAPPTVDPFLVG